MAVEYAEHGRQSPDPPGAARWGLLAGVLLLEYLAISLLIDARDVLPGTRGAPWLGGLAQVSVATAAILAMRMGAMRMGAMRMGSVRTRTPVDRPPFAVRGRALAMHGAAFSVFLGLATQFRGPSPPSVVLWLALGTVSTAALAFALVPISVPRRETALRVSLGLAAGLMAYAAAAISMALWDPLSPLTFGVCVRALRVVSTDVLHDPTTRFLALDGFAVTVAPVCSGYEGIGLASVLVIAYLWIDRARLRFPDALVLLPLGVAVVWAGNVVRLIALMMIGAWWDPELALQAFHSKAGWVFFCAATLGVVGWGSTRFTGARETAMDTSSPAARWENPRAAYLLPLVTLQATALVTGSLTNGVDALYGARVLTTAAVVVVYRRTIMAALARTSWTTGALVGLAIGIAWVVTVTESGASRPSFAEPGYTAWVASRIVGSVMLVPLAEELAFRGFLMRWLERRQFDPASTWKVSHGAWLLSALAFGLAHPDRFIAGTLSGLAFGSLVRRTGRLGDAVVAHIVANAVVAFDVLAFGRWVHW